MITPRPDESSTIIKKRFYPSTSGSNAWPAGVTKGSVILVKDRVAGQFTATLVAIGKVPQPLVTYYGALGDLPAFLVHVRLVDPPDVGPLAPILDVAVMSTEQPVEGTDPNVPGSPTGTQSSGSTSKG